MGVLEDIDQLVLRNERPINKLEKVTQEALLCGI
jgi:hypothetical protein